MEPRDAGMHMSKSEWKGVQAHVHDRNLAATNSDLATRPAHVESKRDTKERKARQARSPTSGNGRSEVDLGVKEIISTNSSLKPRSTLAGSIPAAWLRPTQMLLLGIS